MDTIYFCNIDGNTKEFATYEEASDFCDKHNVQMQVLTAKGVLFLILNKIEYYKQNTMSIVDLIDLIESIEHLCKMIIKDERNTIK